MVALPRRVRIGLLLVTPGVLERVAGGDRQVALMLLGESIERFRREDWGDVDSGDAKANDVELQEGGRLLAVYHVKSAMGGEKVRIYVIQHIPFDGEEPTNETTILLPEEY